MDSISQVKDKFFLAAKVRPAAMEHYIAWLEAYLDQGGTVSWLSPQSFSEAKFYTVSANATVPKLEGSSAINIIVPPGVTVDATSAGDCKIFRMDEPSASPGFVSVWAEILDTLVEDGYEMSRLLGMHEIRNHADNEIVSVVSQGRSDRSNFYDAFKSLSFSSLDAGLKELQAMTPEDILRRALRLKPGTAIDAKATAILDERKREALDVLEVLHYKLNPENERPIPPFGKKAKAPQVDLQDGIQVGPPLKLKDRGPQP